jgi:hypothetical protein
MTVEQCACELANLLQSGQPPSPYQVSALIHACLKGSGSQYNYLNTGTGNCFAINSESIRANRVFLELSMVFLSVAATAKARFARHT